MKSILILDDEPSRYEYIKKAILGPLEDLDPKYRIHHCSTKEQADLFVAKHGGPDILFLDNDLTREHYHMHMESASELFNDTGYAFVKEQHEDLKHTLVIIHTMNPVALHVIMRFLSSKNIPNLGLPVYTNTDDRELNLSRLWRTAHMLKELTSDI